MTAVMADPAELRHRAAVLQADADRAQRDADALYVQAELAASLPEAESRVTAATEKAEQARAAHDNASSAVAAAEAELAEAHRRMENAEAAIASGDLGIRADARMYRNAFAEDIQAVLLPAIQKAREHQSAVAFECNQAELALERAEAAAEAISGAYEAALTHDRARQTGAWQAYAVRFWEAVIADPRADVFTPEHRQVAWARLLGLLSEKAAQGAALDVAARVTADRRRTQPQLTPNEDGRWTALDYSSLTQPRDADIWRLADDARSAVSLNAADVADMRSPAMAKLLDLDGR
jgi:hypothetical protein